MQQSFSSSQLRAARALLNWSRAELAEKTGVSEPTLHRLENNIGDPETRTQKKIRYTLEEHGIEFTSDDGVKKRSDSVVKLEGFDDFKYFMDQVYYAATQPYSIDGTKPICICNLDNSLFRKHMKDHHPLHVERLKKISGLKIRSLSAEADRNHVAGADYLVYRYLRELKGVVAPFYVFGDTFAVLDFNVVEPPKIIMVHSPALARSYRDQFAIMWRNASAKPLM